MNFGFSVDDLTDSFWQPPAAPGDGITRSQSEWAFKRLLEEMSTSSESPPISSSSATDNAISQSTSQLQSEPSVSKQGEAASDGADVVEIQKPKIRAPSSDSSAEMDPNHYQAILKSKLELACAAVALRVASGKPEDSSASSGNQKQPAPTGSQTQGPAATQTSPCVSSVSAATSLGTQNKPDTQVRRATSGSSRDDSDDEDLDGDAENADPAHIKRAKRKISNRESARRSRKRKAEQMNELDTQVKMAEETVKRVTGRNPLLVARPNSIPFNSAPISNIGLKNSTNVPLPPQNVAFSSHLPAQVNHPFVPASCNGYETLPHWNHAAGKNKPQE
ncbi:unnamed protein product [Microthlaspi erraticum]|uniref:BZIP domain-containing protein n=1 Tax=Microthlaspi erraticum TaxID=1685480 RepID=A0A6D2KSG6_9BRAS|nr:unnamed protein product [Microthlaspi erraticum]